MNEIPPIPNSAPALWNPNAAANWSLLFTPAFGAFIHARNAETLGRLDEAKSNRKWFYASLIFSGISLLSVFAPGLSDAPFRMVGLVILLAWYFTLGKKQASFVKETYASGYIKKPWSKPLLIGFACVIGLFIVAFALAFIAEMLAGTQGA